MTHYRHLDHLWSVLRGAALAVHWWNPLVWLAVFLSRRDGELACDESTLKQLGDGERKAYGETLLSLVTAKPGPRELLCFATTMSGGKKSLQERIRRIACKQKVLVSATVAVILLLCLTVICAFGRNTEERDTDYAWDGTISFEGMEAGAYRTSWEAEAQDERVIAVDFKTNSTEISLQNHSDVDLSVFLYHEESWPAPILEMELPAGGRDTFQNLTSRLTYWISVRTDAPGVVDLTVSDGAGGSALYTAEHTAEHPETDAAGEVNWQLAKITVDEAGVPHIRYAYSEVEWEGNHIPAPREWAGQDLAGRDQATALENCSEVWAKLVSATDGWLVACYEQGVAMADTYVYKTSDGGMNWTEVTMPGTSWHIADVGFLSPERLIVAQRLFDGAPCFITKDGGETWEEIELADTQVLAIRFDGGTVIMHVGAHEEDQAVSAMISTDMGDNWTVSPPVELPQGISADLDHDGVPDELLVRTESDFRRAGASFDGTYWTLQCNLSGGGVWEIEGEPSLPGCNAVFLYQMDGEDYLLVYLPEFWHGEGYYQYRLIYLDGGREVVVQENSLDFDVKFYNDSFDPQKIADFMGEVNTLLSGSVQLVNTNIYLQQVFDSEGRLYDSLYWLDADDDLSLLENLQNYAAYGQDHPDDTWSPLADLLQGLTAGDISSFDGDVSKLVRLLQEGERGSRFYTWENKDDAYYGHGADEVDYNVWGLPLMDGDTLWLMACEERASVLLILESADEAVSAFYDAPELRDAIISEEGLAYPMEELPYTPDLDHDGKPDRLLLWSAPDGTSQRLQWEGTAVSSKYLAGWSAQASTSHAGWNALFLCRLDGEDYLLQYNPYMGSGICGYQYRLFYLGIEGMENNGGEIVVQENSVEFDVIFADEFAEHHSFDPEAIAAFMDEINSLLANGVQLINTDGNLLSTFEKEGRLYDSLWWLDDDFERDGSKSLLENLLAYQDFCQAPAVYRVPEEGSGLDLVFTPDTGGLVITGLDAAHVEWLFPNSADPHGTLYLASPAFLGEVFEGKTAEGSASWRGEHQISINIVVQDTENASGTVTGPQARFTVDLDSGTIVDEFPATEPESARLELTAQEMLDIANALAELMTAAENCYNNHRY